MIHSRGTRGNKDRKIFLDKQKMINCGRCPIHRGENAQGKRHPRDDRHKNHRRV